MTGNTESINRLLNKLESLMKRQESFSKEIQELRDEINRLKYTPDEESLEQKEPAEIETPEPEINQTIRETGFNEQPLYMAPYADVLPGVKSNIEKFIGENLINKIGIAIMVIGVAIGAKYSIEHQLISALTRIVLGYLMGLGLLVFGIRLKKNYHNYSAVLVSGAIAIMYFITYAAYSFYDLIPQVPAFLLMVVFTAFTVVASLNYNRQIIAHIGLVGAYAVPFLLSETSGKVAVLFGYIAVINAGILLIAFKKYWKLLNYSAFILTWLIFVVWYVSEYQVTDHFVLSLAYLFVFFAVFYLMILAYKLIQKETFETGDVVMLLGNSFIFYGLGYSILNSHSTGMHTLGLFTLGNALIHFVAGVIIYRQKLADRNLFFLVAGLVLVFVTIAIPVQLDGNWVTLIWACEAALLFWIGRVKLVPVYEQLSYPLIFLAFFSLAQDWIFLDSPYIPGNPATRMIPFLNLNFLTAAVFIACFVFINQIQSRRKPASSLLSAKTSESIMAVSIPGILIIVLYFTFRIEIAAYWDQLYADSMIKLAPVGQAYPARIWNTDLTRFKNVSNVNYSLLFLTLLSLFNIKRMKHREMGLLILGLQLIGIMFFLTLGLYNLSELRDSYLNQALPEYYHQGPFHIWIRYISLAFAGLILTSAYRQVRQDFLLPYSMKWKTALEVIVFISVLWIASSELINWMDILRFSQSYKLGLSILWGVYALIVIAFGIWKRKKHLRIGAIVLFAITLIKLFMYDISHLNTIAKTIVFVLLGILLLITSFLYNKYTTIISEDDNS
jgi:uncharacterized membrane protein